MDEMIEIAKSFYERASKEDKCYSRKWFRAVDADGDRKLSSQEFYEICTQSDFNFDYIVFEPEFSYREIKVFKQFLSNSDVTRDLEHMLAMCYAIEVDMPICDMCEKLLPGLHFSCFRCQKEGEDPYSLCCACYRGGEFNHQHMSIEFVDSLSMLKMLRESKNLNYDEKSEEEEEEGEGEGEEALLEMLMISLESRVRNLENIAAESSKKLLFNMLITAIFVAVFIKIIM